MVEQHPNIRPPADTKELRFAVTMNGGVSLAVYIGGVAQELNLVSKATPVVEANTAPPDSQAACAANPYGALLSLLGFTAPAIDVITGTSAGGINAAALAVAQADMHGDISVLKPLWLQDAQIEAMLRKPFQKGAPSLMKGDEYFLPLLQSAFRQMTSNKSYKRSPCDIDLTITTTLLTPYDARSSDDLGTEMVEPEFAGQFKFSGPADLNATDEPDHFSEDNIGHTAEALALAARASAGFPVAFEPTFIPVNDRPFSDRPDMAPFASWAHNGNGPASRYGMDGGVLNNTPTLPALEAIQKRAPKGKFIRRVLILVHPHAIAAKEVDDRPDEPGRPPTLLEAIQGVAKAATSVGSKAYMAEFEDYNRRALRWRDSRTVALTKFHSWDQLKRFLDDQPRSAWHLFRSMRIQRNAAVMANAVFREGELTRAKVKEEAQKFLEEQDGPPQLNENPTQDVSQERDNAPHGLPYLPQEPSDVRASSRG
jgi:patatin-related protein